MLNENAYVFALILNFFVGILNAHSCSKHESSFGLVTWAKGEECPACFAFSMLAQSKKQQDSLRQALGLWESNKEKAEKDKKKSG